MRLSCQRSERSAAPRPTSSWNKNFGADQEEFFNVPGRGAEGVYANIFDDLDTTPVVWHITEVPLARLKGLLCAVPRCAACRWRGLAVCEAVRTESMKVIYVTWGQF